MCNDTSVECITYTCTGQMTPAQCQLTAQCPVSTLMVSSLNITSISPLSTVLVDRVQCPRCQRFESRKQRNHILVLMLHSAQGNAMISYTMSSLLLSICREARWALVGRKSLLYYPINYSNCTVYYKRPLPWWNDLCITHYTRIFFLMNQNLVSFQFGFFWKKPVTIRTF